ncbi:MAG: AAA family ATPase [Planctomycetaceae bacterium]|nr:AAA family ATPase [Planctomycetaceae bacterium]
MNRINGIKVEQAPADVAADQANEHGDPIIYSLSDLGRAFPKLREPIVDGYLRRGETMNAIAASKIGKTMLILQLAFAVARGGTWLGAKCTPGRVLLIDNELHGETLNDRAKQIGSAVGDHDPNIDAICLRGKSWDIVKLVEWAVRVIPPGKYNLIVLDALYRFLPQGTSENDNADMMTVYNTLDFIANHCQAAIAIVHHSSKGAQGDKAQTDVGAGAGSIARAADTHLTIRHHSEEGYQVLEAVTRSFPSPTPKTIFLKFPLWLESDKEPSVKQNKSSGEGKQQRNDAETRDNLLKLLKSKRMSNSQLRGKTGFGQARVARGLSLLLKSGAIEAKTLRKKGSKRKTEVYQVVNGQQ